MRGADIDVQYAIAPLRLLNWFNVGISLVGISAVAGVFTGIVECVIHPAAAGATLASLVLMVTLLAFPVIVAWRTVNVVDALDDHSTVPSLLYLEAISLLFAVLILGGLSLEQLAADLRLANVGVEAAIAAPVAPIAIVALLLLRRREVLGTGLPLRALLRQLASQRRAAAKGRLAPQRPVRGVLLILAGFGVLVGINFIPDAIYAKYGAAITSAFGGGCLLLFYARAALTPTAPALLAQDERRPILLLRSFADDEKIAGNRQAGRAVFDSTLEARLSSHFHDLGPFIAVGSPADPLPVVGAARARLSDDEWQDQVKAWIDEASVIVMLAGTTQWVDWELRQVVAQEAVDRLIVCFPPVAVKGWFGSRRESFARNMEQRRDELARSMANTIWSDAVAALEDPSSLRALVLAADGTIDVVRARSTNRNGYHLAALVANWLLWRNAGVEMAEGPPAAADQPGTRSGAIVAFALALLLLAGAAVSRYSAAMLPIALSLGFAGLILLPSIRERIGFDARGRGIRALIWFVLLLPTLHGSLAIGSFLLGATRSEGSQLTPETVRALRYAAWARLPEAQVDVGTGYLLGIGVERDPARGCKMVREGADGGINADATLARCLRLKALSPRPGENLVGLLEHAWVGGDVEAAAALGDMFFAGDGVPRDLARAARYYEPVARAGNAQAALNLAAIYGDNTAPSHDRPKHVAYLLQAARAGLPAAMADAATLASEGKEMPKDLALALEYNRRAADQGIQVAQLNYGAMLFNGEGTAKDVAAARHYFELAARSSSQSVARLAKKNLAIMDR